MIMVGKKSKIAIAPKVVLLMTIVCFPICLSLDACSFKPRATGPDNEIVFLIDPELRSSFEADLLKTFCPVIETPQSERRFQPLFGGIEELPDLQTQRFLILVGVLDQTGELSETISAMLTPEVIEGVRRGDYFVFSKEDEWASGQQMLILVTPDAASLKKRLQMEKEPLFKLFDNKRNEQVKKGLYRRYEQKDLAEDIRERYGFELRIPHDYVLVREEPEAGWLRLKRGLQPGRWITLWRSTTLDEDLIDAAWLYGTWSSLAAQFADPVRANLDFLTTVEATVCGFPGMEMRGLWETENSKGGGPFLCRAFYNPADRHVYLLEGEVFNPGGEKEPFLKQLEVILDTFKPIAQDVSY
jgi:hypothetical protein